MVNNADKLIEEIVCIYRHQMSHPLSVLILIILRVYAGLHEPFFVYQGATVSFRIIKHDKDILRLFTHNADEFILILSPLNKMKFIGIFSTL